MPVPERHELGQDRLVSAACLFDRAVGGRTARALEHVLRKSVPGTPGSGHTAEKVSAMQTKRQLKYTTPATTAWNATRRGISPRKIAAMATG
jgi:hypothetical protein